MAPDSGIPLCREEVNGISTAMRRRETRGWHQGRRGQPYVQKTAISQLIGSQPCIIKVSPERLGVVLTIDQLTRQSEDVNPNGKIHADKSTYIEGKPSPGVKRSAERTAADI